MTRSTSGGRSKGCELCRSKKVKCDEGQPECMRCQRAGRRCSGPIRGRIFVNAGPQTIKIKTVSKRPRVTQLQLDLSKSHTGPEEEGEEETEDGEGEEDETEKEEEGEEEEDDNLMEGDMQCVSTAALPSDQGQTLISLRQPPESGSLQANSFPSKLRFIGEGRVDPFSTFARATTARERYLMDFYTRDIFSLFGGSVNAPYIPQRDSCFSVVVKGIASMEVMFAYAAIVIAQKLGYPETEGRKYMILCAQNLNKAISDPSQCFLDSTIMAALGCINRLYQLQKSDSFLPEEQQEANAHIQGVRYLIKGRGGFMAICFQSAISWITVTTDLLTFGEISAGCTPLSLHTQPAMDGRLSTLENRSTNKSQPQYQYSFLTLVAEYTGAFCNFAQEAQTRSCKYLSTAAEDSSYISISRLFRPGVHIHRILTNPNCVGIPRIAVLFLLNIILWDHRQDLQSLFEGYFKEVRIRMVEEGLDLDGTTDLLLWTLITDPVTFNIHHFEWVWLLARLLRIHRRLSTHLQAQVEEALLQFIISDHGLRKSPLVPETFHSVIIHDLGRPGSYIFTDEKDRDREFDAGSSC